MSELERVLEDPRAPSKVSVGSLDNVASCGYIGTVRIVGIRHLKDRLSSYLKSVREGEVVVVTDRGEAVAELCPVGYAGPSRDTHPGLLELARQRRATLGAPNHPDLYPALTPLLPEGSATLLLDELRGDH